MSSEPEHDPISAVWAYEMGLAHALDALEHELKRYSRRPNQNAGLARGIAAIKALQRKPA